MATVGRSTIIMVFILIFVISLVAATLVNPEEFDKTRFRTFLVTAASLGIVIAFVWYFFLLEQHLKSEDDDNFAIRRRIEEGIIDASVSDIQKNSDIIPNFCASLFPLQEFEYTPPIKYTKKEMLHEVTLSYRLFDTWEHYISGAIHPVSDISYFLQWASSPLLESQWKKQYVNFSKETQKFGDCLFERAKTICDRTPEAYEKEAYQIFRKHCCKK